MDRKSTKNLRLDQRLTGRRNWISPADLENELDSLPDAFRKSYKAHQSVRASAEKRLRGSFCINQWSVKGK